jgi:hypothetical protein
MFIIFREAKRNFFGQNPPRPESIYSGKSDTALCKINDLGFDKKWILSLFSAKIRTTLFFIPCLKVCQGLSKKKYLFDSK